MNIIANAIDALDSMSEGRSFAEMRTNLHKIEICTEVSTDGKTAIICIKDNAQGIPEEIQSRIFDHLFTTKEVGKGTGLGLASAHQIVVEKHGGAINVNSTLGQGTEFVISLPV